MADKFDFAEPSGPSTYTPLTSPYLPPTLPTLPTLPTTLQALVEKVCNDVTSRAKMSDEPVSTTEEVTSSNGAPHRQRSKSMSKQKEEQAARVAAVRQAAAEAQMLGDFIRLADYMTVSCCFLLTVNTAERLLEIMTSPRKNGAARK